MSISKFLKKADTSNITLGSDVEYFLFSPEESMYMPASAITWGTKTDPEPIDDGIDVHTDNISLEHSVPVSTLDNFEFNMLYARKKVSAFAKNSALKLDLVQECYRDTSFDIALQLDPEYTEFGCNPFKTPDGKVHDLGTLKEGAMRFTGMHIHIGYPKFSSENNAEVIRLLDKLCEINGLIDHVTPRSRSYGIAGAYRDTKYGVEYRRLTNNLVDKSQLIGELATLSAALVSAGYDLDSVDLNQINDVKYLTKLFEDVKENAKVAVILG